MHTTTPRNVVLYSADRGVHVCPTVRVVGPLRHAGWTVLMGYEWSAGELHIFPERVAEADFVVIQRDFPRYEDAYEQIVASAHDLGKPIVYELDDLLVEMPGWHPDVRHYREARAAMLRAAFVADLVTCSTREICDYLGAYNARTSMLPNYLDDRLWGEALDAGDTPDHLTAGERRGPLVVGYVGGSSHLLDLEMVKPALVEILQRYGSDLSLRFWGGAPPADLLERKNVEWLDPGLVDYGEFARYFRRQRCDIVIAPLRDCQFNRAKSGLKFLEYSALGLPGVYSDVLPYRRLVEQRENGFLATTLEDWADALSQLIEMPEMRREMGEAARRTVREEWLLSHHAHEWATAYERVSGEVVGRRTPAARSAVRQLSYWYREIEEDLTEQEQTNADLKQELVEELMAQEAEHQREMQQLEQRLQQQIAEREAVIEAITTSPGWRFLKVAGDVRQWFIPRHSLRERILYSAMQRVLSLKQEGVKSALTGVSTARDEGLPEQKRHPFPVRIVAGDGGGFPKVSVLLIEGLSIVDEQMVGAWADNQTYPNVEVVTWDEERGIARIGGDDEGSVDARDVSALREALRGRYVCVASEDLLRQPATYLEANVLALETESLAFTLNVRGSVDEFVNHLRLQRLPGDGKSPLLRQVVRTGCVGDDLAVDLSDWRGGPVAGKILVHTTHHTDHPPAFDARLVGRDVEVLGHYAVIDRESEEWVHDIHPVGSVLPSTVVPSELPTVVVAFPFLAVGGAERVALDMMRCLQREIRFVVVTTEGYDPALGTTADAFREITPYVFTAPDFLLSPLNLSFLQHVMERFEVDTFYIANGSEWLYSVLTELRRDYPGLRTANQVYDYRFGWINRYDEDLVAHLDAHIGVNRRICEAYVAQGVPPEESYLVENGVDTEEFDLARYPEDRRRSLRHKLGLSPDRRLVTFISRLHPQKRPMDFVELARRFSGEEGLQFLMVGGGPLAGTIDAEVLRIGLKNFERRPFYRPSSDIFAISDVLVLPSEYEGMPLVILEAQAMGKPMVVTDVGNNREVLDITQGGVVVSRIGDVSALREGVIRMLEDPPDPQEIRQSILDRFSLQRMAEKYRIALLGE